MKQDDLKLLRKADIEAYVNNPVHEVINRMVEVRMAVYSENVFSPKLGSAERLDAASRLAGMMEREELLKLARLSVNVQLSQAAKEQEEKQESPLVAALRRRINGPE